MGEREPVHLGSNDHERHSVQRSVLAVTDRELSAREATQSGLHGRDVFCWHYSYWEAIPADQRTDNRVACYFHHHMLHGFDDPQVVAGVCMNRRVAEALRQRQPHKTVRLVHVGGVEEARPHAQRRHPTRKIRLLLVGNPLAPMPVAPGEARPLGSRKGPELVLPIAERLDRRRYAWVFIGPNWRPQAGELARRGWTVLCPDELPDPAHFVYFGEGDIFLMLSRLEGGPLPLLEAMGLGIWPICTETGLAPEVLNPGENGHLLPAYVGTNLAEVADAAAAAIRSLDRETLHGAREQVQASVAEQTWINFRGEIQAIMRDIFG